MTTANPTTRIDLDALAADLTAAGWKHVMDTHYVTTTEWGEQRIYQHNGSCGGTIAFRASGDVILKEVNIADPIWQHALDLIRAHTTEAPQ